MAHYFPYDVKLRLLAHSRSFLANQKARNAIVGAENLLNSVSSIFSIHFFRDISYNVWVHVAVTWSQVSRIAKIFIDGIQSGSKDANSGLSSYEIMSNSHTYYQVGIKKDSSETFYGFVRDLKVFKRLLTADEINQEAGRFPY